ncbi:transposase [Streptomyces poonensis]|uniref:transposase n=1 Tax=Streptomyces poonensis TaxID=68255 RepID=UPI003570B13C
MAAAAHRRARLHPDPVRQEGLPGLPGPGPVHRLDDRPRALALLPRQSLHEIQTRNRLEQRDPQWQRRYAIRAGIEATLSQAIGTCGLRRSRYRGLARTHVQHVLTAMACNFTRLADWFDTAPTASRRDTDFRTLCTAAGLVTAPTRSPTKSRHWT